MLILRPLWLRVSSYEPLSSDITLGTKAFVNLQKRWYKKLKKLGFHDLESFDSKGDFWPLLSGDKTKITEARLINAKYYEYAKDFYHKHSFRDEYEQTVWELHSEGHSLREIEAKLKETGIKTRMYASGGHRGEYLGYASYPYIFHTVKRLKTLMFKRFKLSEFNCNP